MTSQARRVAVVVGANLGLGASLLRAMRARGWPTFALGRPAALGHLGREIADLEVLPCDVTDAAQVHRAVSDIEANAGAPSVVVYNVHRIELASALATTPEAFEAAWRASCLGAFLVAQRVLPGMQAAGAGTLVFSGATASLRGGARSAGFAAAKFALRGLAQALAREFSGAGIHVAHVVLDGLVDSERTRVRFGAGPERCMDPDEIARVYMGLVDQTPRAWTHELDLRPATEKF